MRDRAILLVMISSGQARAETMDLRLSDMTDIDSDNITTLDISRQKTKTNYRTFFSPEATLAVQAYLNERKERVKKNNEKNKKLKNGKPEIIDNCPNLFVTRYGDDIRPLYQDAFNNIFLRLAEKMGEEFRTDPYTFNMLRSHNFRKFFKSQMQNAGVPAWQCEYMMGHTLSPLDKAYFMADKDKLKENYKAHMNCVMIEMEIINIDNSDELAELRRELEESKKRETERDNDMIMIKKLLQLQNAEV